MIGDYKCFQKLKITIIFVLIHCFISWLLLWQAHLQLHFLCSPDVLEHESMRTTNKKESKMKVF